MMGEHSSQGSHRSINRIAACIEALIAKWRRVLHECKPTHWWSMHASIPFTHKGRTCFLLYTPLWVLSMAVTCYKFPFLLCLAAKRWHRVPATRPARCNELTYPLQMPRLGLWTTFLMTTALLSLLSIIFKVLFTCPNFREPTKGRHYRCRHPRSW